MLKTRRSFWTSRQQLRPIDVCHELRAWLQIRPYLDSRATRPDSVMYRNQRKVLRGYQGTTRPEIPSLETSLTSLRARSTTSRGTRPTRRADPITVRNLLSSQCSYPSLMTFRAPSLRRQGRLPCPRQDVNQARGRQPGLEGPRRQGEGRPGRLEHLLLQEVQRRRFRRRCHQQGVIWTGR